MNLRIPVFFLTLSMMLLLVPTAPAKADGRHFSIDGPDIVTPAGTPTTGNYGRNSFLYTVPEGEKGGGSLVAMRLLDENTVQLATGGNAEETAKSPTQIWKRCFPVTS